MKERKVYFENLDGLRFFAAFLVFIYHLSIWLHLPNNLFGKFSRIILSMDSSGGEAGVRFFFVLSGFLITYLMFEEESKTNSFSVFKFYVRRILRIWPLYFITLIIGFVIYPIVVSSAAFNEQANPLMYASFLANFDNIFGGKPQTGILGVQWSVSVEEQFYLIWPLLFVPFAKGGRFIWVILFLLTISFVYAQRNGHPYHPLSCARELSLGALAAWLGFFHRSLIVKFFSLFSKRLTILSYVFGIFAIFFGFQFHKHFEAFGHWYSFLISVFFVFVITEQNYSPHSFFKAGELKIITHWGKRSYGLYLLHMVAITLSLLITDMLVVEILLAFIFTFLFSGLTYRFVEKPCLSLGTKFRTLYP